MRAMQVFSRFGFIGIIDHKESKPETCEYLNEYSDSSIRHPQWEETLSLLFETSVASNGEKPRLFHGLPFEASHAGRVSRSSICSDLIKLSFFFLSPLLWRAVLRWYGLILNNRQDLLITIISVFRITSSICSHIPDTNVGSTVKGLIGVIWKFLLDYLLGNFESSKLYASACLLYTSDAADE